MELETREIDCAEIERLLRIYPQEMAVIVEMLEEIDEIPCQQEVA